MRTIEQIEQDLKTETDGYKFFELEAEWLGAVSKAQELEEEPS